MEGRGSPLGNLSSHPSTLQILVPTAILGLTRGGPGQSLHPSVSAWQLGRRREAATSTQAEASLAIPVLTCSNWTHLPETALFLPRSWLQFPGTRKSWPTLLELLEERDCPWGRQTRADQFPANGRTHKPGRFKKQLAG